MAKPSRRSEWEIYRVTHNGGEQALVSGPDPKSAAERYVKQHKATGGFVCVRDSAGRETRYLLRSRKRETKGAGRATVR
jgi:hypothetical protein